MIFAVKYFEIQQETLKWNKITEHVPFNLKVFALWLHVLCTPTTILLFPVYFNA